MENQFTILGFGISGVGEKWASSLNNTKFVDRIYYILEEGAGYIIDGIRHYFIKNHLYLINHNCKIEYFVEDYGFKHAYIDYSSAMVGEFGEVLECYPEKGSILEADVSVLLSFLKTNNFGNFRPDKKVISPQYLSKRVLLILKSFIADMELNSEKRITNTIISSSLKYIHDNFSTEISVEKLARDAFLSKNQFSRIFLKETGLTPYQYIKEYRFDMAILMMKEGMSISDVSLNCGFLSGSAFSNSFKKRFGYSPTKIIKR